MLGLRIVTVVLGSYMMASASASGQVGVNEPATKPIRYVPTEGVIRTPRGGVAPLNCAKPAAKSAEEVVCHDWSLMALDWEMRRLYVLAIGPRGQATEPILMGAQSRWFDKRDACVATLDANTCIRVQYTTRIATLRQSSNAQMASRK